MILKTLPQYINNLIAADGFGKNDVFLFLRSLKGLSACSSKALVSSIAILTFAFCPYLGCKIVQAARGESAFDERSPVLDCLANFSATGWSSTPLKVELLNTTSGSLSDPINAVLIEYGCLERAKRVLQRGQRQIFINVYNFNTNDGAFGAYCYLRQGSSNVITKGDASSEDQQSIWFCKNKYFISVYGTANDDDESKSLVTQIANQLASAVPVYAPHLIASKPEIILRLPAFELVKGSEKLIMGPLAAKRFLSAPYVITLGSEKIKVGAIADYQLQDPYRERLKLLLAEYPSAEAAMHVYARYTGELEAQHKSENLDGLYYQSSAYKLASGHILCQLRGQVLLIITGARKKNSLAALAGQIY